MKKISERCFCIKRPGSAHTADERRALYGRRKMCPLRQKRANDAPAFMYALRLLFLRRMRRRNGKPMPAMHDNVDKTQLKETGGQESKIPARRFLIKCTARSPQRLP